MMLRCFVLFSGVLCLNMSGLVAGPEVDANHAMAQSSIVAGETASASDQFFLGVKYLRGEGVPFDPKLGIALYQQSAARGNSCALTNLAFEYKLGLHVKKDLQKAYEMLQQAAQQGNLVARVSLADMYVNSEGVQQDLPRARKLCQEALKQGYGGALFVLGSCYLKMSAAGSYSVEALKWLHAYRLWMEDQNVSAKGLSFKQEDAYKNKVYQDCLQSLPSNKKDVAIEEAQQWYSQHKGALLRKEDIFRKCA